MTFKPSTYVTAVGTLCCAYGNFHINFGPPHQDVDLRAFLEKTRKYSVLFRLIFSSTMIGLSSAAFHLAGRLIEHLAPLQHRMSVRVGLAIAQLALGLAISTLVTSSSYWLLTK